VGGASPERSARTTFRKSVSSGRRERDSEDQASTVVGDRSFLASLRNTRQFETFTDGVGGWCILKIARTLGVGTSVIQRLVLETI
jgi:hypothetical protein